MLKNNNLCNFLKMLQITSLTADQFEVLGEKALPEGHIDILLKERVPIGQAMKIPIEVKLNRARVRDLEQVRAYMDELGKECFCGVLIAASFGKEVIRRAGKLGIKLILYTLSFDWNEPRTFEEILNHLKLESVEGKYT
ncbi:MAG: hypothetical protein ACUVV0_08745 [Anaerolineae bacterium]